jgi:DNA/RNA-binding domain of Phe-tRNA-synthetase-like protein
MPKYLLPIKGERIQMKIIVEPEEKLKGIQVVASILRNVNNAIDTSREFESFISYLSTKLKQKYADPESILKDAKVRMYRDFYWKVLQLDPTKTRPANEALLRRVIFGEGLPRINMVTDACNAAIVYTMIPMSVYDLDLVKGEKLVIRSSIQGESFLGIGMNEPVKLTGREVVFCDEEGILCEYPYRDSQKANVTKASRNILLTVFGVPGLSGLELLWALKVATRLILKFVGGEYEFIL